MRSALPTWSSVLILVDTRVDMWVRLHACNAPTRVLLKATRSEVYQMYCTIWRRVTTPLCQAEGDVHQKRDSSSQRMLSAEIACLIVSAVWRLREVGRGARYKHTTHLIYYHCHVDTCCNLLYICMYMKCKGFFFLFLSSHRHKTIRISGKYCSNIVLTWDEGAVSPPSSSPLEDLSTSKTWLTSL